MKILVSGPINSQEEFIILRDKVSDLHLSKHGPFDVLAITGSVIIEEYKTLYDSNKLPHLLNGEKDGVVTYQDMKFGFYALEDSVKAEVVKMNDGSNYSLKVDILFTSRPPYGFNAGLPPNLISIADDKSGCSEFVSMFVTKVAPKYHFVCNFKDDLFYQRPPYLNNQQSNVITRLIALSHVSSEKKKEKKWLHAFNFSITDEVVLPPPSDITVNPFTFVPPPPLPSSSSNSATTKARPNNNNNNNDVGNKFQRNNNGNRVNNKKQHRIPPRMDCWFCLASKSLEEHLIVSVMEDSYIALPKGGIQIEHALIVPISHEPCLAAVTEESLVEIANNVNAISNYFEKKGYSSLVTERSLVLGKAAQRHCYLEILPIPKEMENSCENVFLEEAVKSGNLDFQLISEAKNNSKENLLAMKKYFSSIIDKEGLEYLYVSLPNGKTFVYKVKEASASLGIRAPLYFGRSIACKLLNKIDRVQWKACVQSKEKETQWTDELRNALE